MTADDLSAPLGQGPLKRQRTFLAAVPFPLIIAGVLGVFFAVFVIFAVVTDDPFGGEPMAAVSVDLRPPATPAKPEAAAPPRQQSAAMADNAAHNEAPAGAPSVAVPPAERHPANTRTVTIIDGKTGERRDVVIPAAPPGAGGAVNGAIDQKFVELTPRGPIPKIAADGTRPAEAFARPVKPIPGKPDAPRIALIVGGLGVSANLTEDAIAKLPAAVTLAFMPYSAEVDQLVAHARGNGHEVLLQAPLEPFGYPDNDSGPQTLLTSLTPEQNLERLHWLMSRFQGYVGVVGAMGARFTASEPALAPVLQEIARRGLIFVDDGSNPRSIAGRIASADNLSFAKAELNLDAVPTAAEIDRALGRLEMAAHEHGSAVGFSAALPVSIERIAKWAKGAENRGVLLVPITAVALKPKQS